MMRRLSFNGESTGDGHGVAYRARSGEEHYDAPKLAEELQLMLEREGLLLSDLERDGLPEMMNRHVDFGLSAQNGVRHLDANQFELWRERIDEAVAQGQRLQVFYFEACIGKGTTCPQ